MKLSFEDRRRGGYSLIEALVYIGLVMVVLGGASLAMYRGLDHLLTVKRNAEDIAAAVNVGELWRADIRAGSRGVKLVNTDDAAVLEVSIPSGQVTYTVSGNSLWRAKDGARAELLSNLKKSTMAGLQRGDVLAWKWELELLPRTKGTVKAGKVRPLFTFLAVQPQTRTP